MTEPRLPEPGPLLLGLRPAATKKTGTYETLPVMAPIPRREGETDEHYEARKLEEQKRLPRPRKKFGGICFAFPDCCYIPTSPPILVPFPNIAYLKDAVGCVETVLVEAKPIVVETSEIPTSTWDEMGSIGGMLSGTVADKVTFLEYSSKVFVQGKAVVYLGVKTAHNNYNALGKFTKPGQNKVWVAP